MQAAQNNQLNKEYEMKKYLICFLIAAVLLSCVAQGLADETEGDLYTFCPALSTLYYNSTIKGFLDLNDTQAALLQVTSDGIKDGNLVYSDALQTTFFFFGGASGEYDTAATAYIHCSLKDNSTLKNIPMIIWASIIDYKYNGEIKETGSSFLEWVNNGRTDGDTYTSPYFIATYSEEPKDYCSLLLIKR